jgi:hypothetical protein
LTNFDFFFVSFFFIGRDLFSVLFSSALPFFLFQKRKMVGESTSTQVLRDLEISLRTNHIEWVKEFLDDENQGLDALIDYLSFRLSMMRHEQRIQEAKSASDEMLNPKDTTLTSYGSNETNNKIGTSQCVPFV